MKQRKLLVSYLSLSTAGLQSGTAILWVDIDVKMTEALYKTLS